MLRRLITCLFALCMAASSFAQKTWYVSPEGDDGNNGMSLKAPFRTLARAIEALKREDRGVAAEYRVVMREGVYPVAGTIRIGPGLRLHPGSKLTITAYKNEKPVLSGNKVLTGKWTKVKPNIWKISVEEDFRQLFADNRRMVRGRFPNEGEWIQPDTIQLSENRLVFSNKIPVGFEGIRDAELHITGYWHYIRQKIASIDTRNQAIFTENYPGPECSSRKISTIDRAHFENSLLFLDTADEWFLDRAAGELFFYSAADPSSRRFEYPVPVTLLRVEGSRELPLRQISIEGIVFRGTEWVMPEIERKGIQAGYWGTETGLPVFAPAASLMLEWVEDSRISNCRFELLGEGAISLGLGCTGNAITGNDFYDVGSNVIQVGYRAQYTGEGHPLHLDFKDPAEVCSGTVISNNHLKKFGTTDKGGVGIWIGYSHHNQVSHNLLEDFPYAGMSVGWRWTDTTRTNCHDNIIEWNEVRDGMKYLSDGAGIYLVGNQPGSKVNDNWVHDIGGGYTINAGIYIDEGGANIEIARNYFLNLTNPREAFPIKLHKNAIATMNIHDNGGEKGKHPVLDANPHYLPSKYVNVRLAAPPNPRLYGLQRKKRMK